MWLLMFSGLTAQTLQHPLPVGGKVRPPHDKGCMYELPPEAYRTYHEVHADFSVIVDAGGRATVTGVRGTSLPPNYIALLKSQVESCAFTPGTLDGASVVVSMNLGVIIDPY